MILLIHSKTLKVQPLKFGMLNRKGKGCCNKSEAVFVKVHSVPMTLTAKLVSDVPNGNNADLGDYIMRQTACMRSFYVFHPSRFVHLFLTTCLIECVEVLVAIQAAWRVMVYCTIWSPARSGNIIIEYRIEYVTYRLLYVIFTSPTRIFYRGVPGFATDCPCGVWCRGLTTCHL